MEVLYSLCLCFQWIRKEASVECEWGRGAGCLRRELWGQSILGFSNISSSFLPQCLCICWPFCLELKKKIFFFSQFYWDIIDMTCVCAQLCLTLCDPKDCSRPGSSVHRIFQARILEWVAISCSKGSSQSRDWTFVSWVSWIAGRLFTHQGNREAQLEEMMWLLLMTEEQIFNKRCKISKCYNI